MSPRYECSSISRPVTYAMQDFRTSHCDVFLLVDVHPRQRVVRLSSEHELAHRCSWYVHYLLVTVSRNSSHVFEAVQGLGGGGILSVSSIIMADLVPLSERGTYNGLTGMLVHSFWWVYPR